MLYLSPAIRIVGGKSGSGFERDGHCCGCSRFVVLGVRLPCGSCLSVAAVCGLWFEPCLLLYWEMTSRTDLFIYVLSCLMISAKNSVLNNFLQCALQQPQIDFEDTAGKKEIFDADVHRELAAFGEAAPDARAGPGLPPDLGRPQGLDLVGRGDGDLGFEADGKTCHIVFPATCPSFSWLPSDASKSGVIVC